MRDVLHVNIRYILYAAKKRPPSVRYFLRCLVDVYARAIDAENRGQGEREQSPRGKSGENGPSKQTHG